MLSYRFDCTNGFAQVKTIRAIIDLLKRQNFHYEKNKELALCNFIT